MATILDLGSGSSVNLATGFTTTGASTNVAQRRGDRPATGAIVRVVTTVGATPTITWQLEASLDGTNWFPLPNQDIPTTPGALGALSSAAVGPTTTASTWYRLIPVDFPWLFIRTNVTANTNTTFNADVWVF